MAIESVKEAVKRVRDAHRAAIYELEQKLPQTEQVKNWRAGLGSLGGPIDAWAKRGEDGASGKTKGFDLVRWLKAGDIHLQGIAELRGGGETSTLADLEASVDDIKGAAKKAAKVVKKVVVETGAAVGEAAGAATKPLLPILGVAALGLVALAFIKWGPSRG